ncbi:hypothetical protein Syun_021418 [Stephania yunnanensis]|uniref:Uncharacterized protein n=1 Tax=Stephania yunnanensis TaxID=152371 RepID=A0AAP0IFL8_9MAGN
MAIPLQVARNKTAYRLSEPLIGDDGRVYACSERNVFAFESNGSIAWSIHLNFSCSFDFAPVCDGRGKIYLIAENRVLKINPPSNEASESTAEIFFGDELTTGGSEEIIGISISVFGYRQGCKKNISNCYFTSSPVVDQCEGNIYISNTEGQVYSLSIRSPHFKWIRDFSPIDILFTITSGDNGRLYVTFPVKALVLALDALTGNILWQSNIGPISIKESSPVVDSNGWISFGSLDGFLYSISPTGVLNKFLKKKAIDSVIQVSPVVDCSGYALYVSQTKVKGKLSHAIGEITYVSALKPIDIDFYLLSPATGSIYWKQMHPGDFPSVFSESDLHYFALDERIFLAFVAAQSQKLASSCSQARTKHLNIYTGNERAMLLFLLFQTTFLLLLGWAVWFCCTFWRKMKLQGKDLGQFLEKDAPFNGRRKHFKRRSKQLEQKVGEEVVPNEVLEKLGDLVREREGIQRKLSTTYSLGRDRTKSSSPSILPLYDGKAKSYSFQGSMKESITTFHTLSETSSIEMSSCDGYNSSWSSQGEPSLYYGGDEEFDAKGKGPAEPGPSSASVMSKGKYWDCPVEHSSDSKGFRKLLFDKTITRESNFNHGEGSEHNAPQGRVRRAWLKRRRTISSTN